jgi:hypothetical protein
LLEKKANGSLDDIDFGSSSLKVGIGNIEEVPSGGAFKLAINGVTSSAIAYNATAISVYNAISNNVSTVALYGADSYGSYLLTATQPNTAMSYSSDVFTLFPGSSVLVGTRRNPTTGIEAQQVVKLVRNPIVYADTFTATPTAGELALTKLQDGSSALNETYELTVGPLARGGSFALVFGANATSAIPLFQSAVSVQASISAGINTVTQNMSVQENGKGGYILAFTGRLGLTNITTPLTLDASGIQFIPMRQTTLTINTAEVEDAFADSGDTTITPTLEIELTQGGTPKTIYQGGVTIRKDLITAGSTVPGARDSYYTKSETDALFINTSCGGINTGGRALLDSTSVTSLHYGNRTLNDYLGNNALTWVDGVQFNATKLGFYNTAVTIQPASTNVVSALVNLGLVASSVTLGNVVSNSTVNVDATGQDLYSGGQISVDWGNRGLRNSSGTTVAFWNSTALSIGQGSGQINLILADSGSFNSISFGTNSGSKIGTTTSQKLAFYNSTPIVQPSNINVVSGLINLGLLASGTTYGVLPQSPRTLTTVTFFGPVTVGGNDVNSTTVSIVGAQPNDICMLGLPTDITHGITFFSHCVTEGQVHIDLLNVTGTQKIQTAATYRITVIGY